LYRADAAIDREQYDAAEKIVSQVHSINPHQQESWALLAVIAHLRGDYEKEKSMRDAALKTWGNNPRVDHLIGMKLSQKYRFKEGAAYQRKALEFDPQYAPASFQLAQDWLRLGQEKVGWSLAKNIADEDKYNVVAHNLMTLYDRIKEFSILEAEGIRVRMESREARIYGDAVLELLSEAKTVLCEKYGIVPLAPIVVEIFPEQKDFAIRTFGLPGGAGFLGVCFGRVITANSPASQGERPSNWQSVLWHEFCHVVTLEKTKNRMPRWLSEGISVYEERQRDPSWGESMTPLYREMLLGDDLTPVSDLSAAFLNPASPIHLQFAYYESSLVIEFLVDRYGIDALKQILDDLGDGLTINDALVRSVGSLQKLDSQFEEFAHKHAESFGTAADWSREEMPEKPTPQELATWVQQHPNNYWGLRALSSAYVAAKQYDLAKPPLEKLRSLDTLTGEQGDPLEMLARVYRELGQADAERETLQRIVSLSSDALPALRRLIELAREEENWDLVAEYAAKVNSVNPLLAEGHLALAEAAEKSERPIETLRSLGALVQMDPVDPAALDYRMAIALTEIEQYDLAKHHVLRALDEAPRYRDAHRLLLKLSQQASEAQQANEPTKTSENQVESR
jgi:tetratricopeptide (TPR) repeat protein